MANEKSKKIVKKSLKLRKKETGEETPIKKDKFGKRVARFYRNNRIYCILMFISLACILIVVTALILYFIGQTRSNPYGRRLTDIESHVVTEDTKKAEEIIKGLENYVKETVRVQGKVIYIDIYVKPETTLEEMKNCGVKVLEGFSQENLSYYDLQFGIHREGYKALYGSKSTSNNTVTWAKYNLDTEKLDSKKDDTNE